MSEKDILVDSIAKEQNGSKKENSIVRSRHSLSHLMTMAVLDMYPDTPLGIGPTIEKGFYQDYDFAEPVAENILPKLEKRIKKYLKQKIDFVQSNGNFEDALEFYKDDPYKTEIINELKEKGEKQVSFYDSDWFHNLCGGPHVGNTSEINPDAFKLVKIAGAYWRGDEKNKMLTRIYGVAFETKEELDAYLEMMEEAKKRDHRKLGKELDLFTFSELVGPGLPLWTPKGTALRNTLDDFVWQLRQERGYQKVTIPHITKKELYEKSGHWQKFADQLFHIKTREGHEFAMKPMNCPHHTQIYNHLSRSYRDLPQRYAETTTCYRDEQTGELHGISRTRAFSQDDAHVFCRTSQVKEEFLKIWDIIDIFYKATGFEKLEVRLSLHDPDNFDKYLGTPELWKDAENQLRELAEERGVEYREDLGEAAFYGPKIDFIAKDSIGREWQVATIQLDINMPERFDLTCINEKGESERIVMIHAAIMGSIERFFSIFIEHHAGAFPIWLSPAQVHFVPVSNENHLQGVKKFAEELKDLGIRVSVDSADETVGKKIRKASGQKIPYVVVVGDKELGGGDWTVRVRGQEEQIAISKKEFIDKVLKEIEEKK